MTREATSAPVRWVTTLVALACALPIAASAEPMPGESRTLTGRLEYRKIPQGRSDAAYDGITFFLKTGDSEAKLWATKEVDANALFAFDGKDVVIRASWIAPQNPSPNEQAPMDPFGNVVPRAGKWAVQSVKSARSDSQAEAAKTLVGKLEYRKIPPGQSDAAYHGVTFFLALDDGRVENLWATKDVNANALFAFNGKRIKVQGSWVPPRMPAPHESAPTDPFGNVMPRAGRWSVTKVEAVP